jgi:hypothetical protein
VDQLAKPIEHIAVDQIAKPIEHIAVDQIAKPIEHIAVDKLAKPIEHIAVDHIAKPIKNFSEKSINTFNTFKHLDIPKMEHNISRKASSLLRNEIGNVEEKLTDSMIFIGIGAVVVFGLLIL